MYIIMTEQEFNARKEINKVIEFEDEWFPDIEKLEEMSEKEIAEKIDFLMWCAYREENDMSERDLEVKQYAKELVEKYVVFRSEEGISQIKKARISSNTRGKKI